MIKRWYERIFCEIHPWLCRKATHCSQIPSGCWVIGSPHCCSRFCSKNNLTCRLLHWSKWSDFSAHLPDTKNPLSFFWKCNESAIRWFCLGYSGLKVSFEGEIFTFQPLSSNFPKYSRKKYSRNRKMLAAASKYFVILKRCSNSEHILKWRCLLFTFILIFFNWIFQMYNCWCKRQKIWPSFFSADHDFGPENDRQIVKTLKSYRSESCPSGWTVPPNTPVRAILRKMETTICQAVTAATQRAAALSTQRSCWTDSDCPVSSFYFQLFLERNL